MNIDENIIRELLEKEVKQQVNKYIASKKFEVLIKQQIQDTLERRYTMDYISGLFEDVMNDKGYMKLMAKDISNKIYNNFVCNIKYINDEDEDEYDW